MPTPDQPTANPTNAWDDLLCPVCEYSLRGLPEPRCPECGELMVADEIRRYERPVPRPALPWDMKRSIGSFLQTWWLVAASPRRTAQHFPPFHLAENARLYARISTIAAITMFVTANAWRIGISLQSFLTTAFGFAIAAPFAYEICESSLTKYLSSLARPTNAPRSATYWQGLIQYLGGFKPLMVLSLSVFFGAQEAIGSYDLAPSLMIAGILVSLMVMVWWSSAIFAMALPWTRGTSRMTGVIALPIVSTALATLVGFFLFGLFVSLARAVISAIFRM